LAATKSTKNKNASSILFPVVSGVSGVLIGIKISRNTNQNAEYFIQSDENKEIIPSLSLPLFLPHQPLSFSLSPSPLHFNLTSLIKMQRKFEAAPPVCHRHGGGVLGGGGGIQGKKEMSRESRPLFLFPFLSFVVVIVTERERKNTK
jgi:hypothetical protein